MSDDIDQKSAALNEQINAQLADIQQGIARIMAENERLRETLEVIQGMHDGNPSLAMADMPELDYARHVLGRMRSIARAAMAGPAEEERG